MFFGLEKKDLLYLAILIGLTFTLLTIFKDTSILGYQRLAELKLQGRLPTIDMTYFPVFLGLAILIFFYLLTRILLKYSPFSVFSASLLFVTAKAFTNNFAAGNVSEPVLLFFGQLISPMLDISVTKFGDILFLLPTSLFAMYILLTKKGEKSKMEIGLIVISFLFSLIYPLLALPFLAVLSAHFFNSYNERKTKDEMLIGGLLTAAIITHLLGFTVQKLVISILAGALMGVVIYTLEFRKKLNIGLLLLLFFLSFQASTINLVSTEKLDSETTNALAQLKGLDQNARITVVSPYLDNTTAPAFIIADKQILNHSNGFTFLFAAPSSTLPKFDYLLLDTLALDDPKRIASAIGTTPSFESFIYVQTVKENATTFLVFYSTKNFLALPVDSRGAVIGDVVNLGGQQESLSRFMHFIAKDTRYTRFIHPRSDTNLNMFKLIFPDNFGTFDQFNVTQIWESNSSRMRLYKIN